MAKREKVLPIDPARGILEVVSTLRKEFRKSDEILALNLLLQPAISRWV